ncbi:hypothetical protein [Neolewinella litorea]|uniref:Uncharacterized protein n=1 Tax=Neolewinella litorea TaxID=2562452 RepID=A0A4S4NLC2_9BACT|nr:hypothetical protein [Neolewinella litorea]THH40694.1 hypothetical protein E4021_08165 [Neolewinella litorea]
MPPLVAGPLVEIEREVRSWVQSLQDSPSERYASRQQFYAKYGHRNGGLSSLGNSELAFMRWQERAVLRPLNSKPPGSAWWSAVNLHYIYSCELAVRAADRMVDPTLLPTPAQLWHEYLNRPDDTTWYRAHNCSIIDGYLTYTALAKKERPPERIFLNVVLYRLLFAQAMVEEAPFAFGDLGRIFASPGGAAVDLLTQFEAFYPRTYPLSDRDIRHVLGHCHCGESLGVQLFDNVLIMPELDRLYRLAADWNRQPRLVELIRNGQPVYPTGRLPRRATPCWVKLLGTLRGIFTRLPAPPPAPNTV